MIELSKFIFVAIKLDDTSKRKLREFASKLILEYNLRNLTKEFCDHITLAFGDEISEEHIKLIGKKIDGISVGRIIFNEKCMCASLMGHWLVEKFHCKREFPHITMRIAPSTFPVYSNSLITWFVYKTPDKSLSTPSENQVSSIDLFDFPKLKGTVVGVLKNSKKEVTKVDA